MTSTEFDQFMGDARSLFNIKLSTREIDIWRKHLGGLRFKEASDMLDRCYAADGKNASLDKLLKHKPSERNVMHDIRDQQPKEDCKLCGGEGCVTAERKWLNNTYEYAFKCVCKNGSRYAGYPEANLTELKQLKKYGTNRFVFEIPNGSSTTITDARKLLNKANSAKPRYKQLDDREGWPE